MRLPKGPISLAYEAYKAHRDIKRLGVADDNTMTTLRRMRRNALLGAMLEFGIALGVVVPSAAVLLGHSKKEGGQSVPPSIEEMHNSPDILGHPNVYKDFCPLSNRADMHFLQDDGQIELSADELKHPDNQKLADDIRALNNLINVYLSDIRGPHSCSDSIYFRYRKNSKPRLKKWNDTPYPKPLPRGQFHCDRLANAPDAMSWERENNVPSFYRPTNVLFIPDSASLAQFPRKIDITNADLVPVAYIVAGALAAMRDALMLSAHPRDEVFSSDIRLFTIFNELSSLFSNVKSVLDRAASNPNFTAEESIKDVLAGTVAADMFPKGMQQMAVYVTARYFSSSQSLTPAYASRLRQIVIAPEREIPRILKHQP